MGVGDHLILDDPKLVCPLKNDIKREWEANFTVQNFDVDTVNFLIRNGKGLPYIGVFWLSRII